MALIAHGGPRRISALLHEIALVFRAREVTESKAPQPKRHYPPKRDRVVESAAMAREMYRL